MDQKPAGETQSALAQGMLDVGSGSPEAPANAIPNVIARLAETETWRNAATVVTAFLLIALGYWSYHGVKDALAQARASELEALLETETKALDVWIDEQRAETARLAREPAIATLLSKVVAAARDDASESRCASVENSELAALLAPALKAQGAAAFHLVDRSGRILATSFARNCGARIKAASFRERLDDVFDGKSRFVRPYPGAERLGELRGESERPIAWIETPVRDAAGRVVAALGIGMDAGRQLAGILATARPGRTVEVFLFSESGLMLSESRFVDELPALGLVPPKAEASAIYQVHLRDPGGDLATGHRPRLDVDARPLTEAAALAVASRKRSSEAERRGVLIEPYRSYRGSDVIGAWRWLSNHDMGMLSEISTEEAFSPLQYLLTAFAVIGGLVVLSLAAALLSSLSIARLQSQFGRLQRAGAYTLERQISEGGMATVYLARHALLKRPTAVKILKKTVASDEFVARFEREVQLASQLLHPNTVAIFDYGRTREGEPYYVMEYLDGIDLAQLVAHSGFVPPARVIHILRQVCSALAEAHDRGIIHRDVKPENVMVCRRGEDDVVKLLDFGLVKMLDSPQTRDLTKQLRILGTPRYMAPERIVNPADVDARSDLYAVGAIGYLLLTGKPVFEGANDLEISNQVMHAPPPRPSARGIQPLPAELDELVVRCLAKERASRPASARVMIEALEALAARLPWHRREATAWWHAYRSAQASGSAAGSPNASASNS